MTETDDEYFAALLEDDPARLYERAPCGYLTTDGDGTIRKVNQTFAAMSGRTAGELVGGLRFADLLGVGGRIYYETHYAPLLHGAGTAREIALDLKHASGESVPVLVNAVAERDAAHRVTTIRVAVFDATHRRAYERELLRAKERAEESEARARALAETLQQTLVPPTPPQIPGLDIAAVYRPAGDGTEVGGDFYDVFRVAPDAWVVVAGDVCGKGAEAAVVTALARHTVREQAMEHASPAVVLRRLNEGLRRSDAPRMCTALIGRLHRSGSGWDVTLSIAGHPLPLLRTATGVVAPVGASGVLLGALPDVLVTDTHIPLAAGELLLIYTDGVTEARRDGEFYGEERLQQGLEREHASAASAVDGLTADVLAFQAGFARDDIVVVGLRAE